MQLLIMVPKFKSIKHFINARRSFLLFHTRLRSCPDVSDKYKMVFQWVFDDGLKKF